LGDGTRALDAKHLGSARDWTAQVTSLHEVLGRLRRERVFRCESIVPAHPLME